jgi:magnesium transporter
LRDEVLLAFFVPAVVYMADAVGTQTETVVSAATLPSGRGHLATVIQDLLSIAACFTIAVALLS